MVGVDLTGPFPTTARGNKMILVIADHFTRWVDAIPIPDGTAETVAHTLEERVFAYLGVPEEIHSDQGRQFESKVLEECCRLWGCTKSRTAPYRPQGNSVVERLNKTVGNSLRSLLLDRDQHDWDLLLPQIMRALRATPHTLTGETANYMMLGREVRLPDNIAAGLARIDSEPHTEYAADLQRRMDAVGERLRSQQKELRQDGSDDPPLYLPGDTIWLRSYFRKKGVNPKLSAKYVGPYVIREVLPFHTYRVEKDGKSSVQHEARIRLHVEGERAHRNDKPNYTDIPLPSPRLHRERDPNKTPLVSQPPALPVTLPRPLPPITPTASRSALTTIPVETLASESSSIPDPVLQDRPDQQPNSPVTTADPPALVPIDPDIPPPRRSRRLQEKKEREC